MSRQIVQGSAADLAINDVWPFRHRKISQKKTKGALVRVFRREGTWICRRRPKFADPERAERPYRAAARPILLRWRDQSTSAKAARVGLANDPRSLAATLQLISASPAGVTTGPSSRISRRLDRETIGVNWPFQSVQKQSDPEVIGADRY